MTYKVFVDDNFHYMDESERYELGEFDTLEAAVAACKRIVDEFLISNYRPGMTAAELLTQYAFFGEDPFVFTGQGTVPFSARDYASERIREICRELDPKDAEAYYNRGVAYHRLEDYQKAIDEYKIAARLGYKNAQDFLKSQGISW